MDKTKFEDLFGDPLYWKEKAIRQIYSANILHEQLQKLLLNSNLWNQEDDQHFISLMDSFFLLTSLSFENLIKGLIVSKELRIADRKVYERKYGFSFNHNLSKMFHQNFRKLSQVELELIIRLQDYLHWMSKYPVPLEKHLEKDVYHGYKHTDPEIIANIQKELFESIDNNVDKDVFTYLTKRNLS